MNSDQQVGIPQAESSERCPPRIYIRPSVTQVGTVKQVQGFSGKGRDVTIGGYFSDHEIKG